MKKIDRTFFESMKLFFYPFSKDPSIYIVSFLIFITWNIPGIINVLFLERIINALSINDKGLFYDVILYYVIIIIIFYSLFYLIRNKGWVNLASSITKTLQRKYLIQYINFDNNKIESIGTGKSIAVILNGFKTWSSLTYDLLESISSILISFFFVVYMVSKVSFFLPFFLIILIIFCFYISVKLNKKIIKFRIQRIEQDNLWIKRIVRILMSKFEIFQSNKINDELSHLDKKQDFMTHYNIKMAGYLSVFFQLPEWIINIILIIIFLYFGDLYFSGEIQLSLLVGISGSFILMQKVFKNTIDFYKNFTKEFSEVEVLWKFFDTTPRIKGYETGNEFKYKKGNIEIKDLNYFYTKTKPVFENFNLKIKGEKILALVGNSGSGKSTLAKLISGYIHPVKGNVIVDGQKLDKTSLKSYYKQIGYLTQEPSIFDGTVIDNLTYAIDRDLIKGELDNIIELSKCGFIYDLPKGLNTEIGERGVKLSGGQKQRLAIAKIFLKNPNIIILDEPTSALDSFSEEQITKAMHNLFKNRTVIVIAHRLQTVKHADKIIVLENGKVVETGNHKELVKQKGIYKRMLDLQSGF